jgi:hypothetical protein
MAKNTAPILASNDGESEVYRVRYTGADGKEAEQLYTRWSVCQREGIKPHFKGGPVTIEVVKAKVSKTVILA